MLMDKKCRLGGTSRWTQDLPGQGHRWGLGLRLEMDESTGWTQIPEESSIDWGAVKEVCAGIGCMGLAASHMGLRVLASLEWNPKVASHLRQTTDNGEVLLGDVSNPADQARPHAAGGPVRGVLMSGFPCQPLSTQGDGKGAGDDRSNAFHSTLQVMWRQQMAAMVLECVPKSLEADYVQKSIQQLAWSMGMDVHQRILHLNLAWPNMRTRWWCIMTFKDFQIEHFPDMPCSGKAPVVGDILQVWPCWGAKRSRSACRRKSLMFFRTAIWSRPTATQGGQAMPVLPSLI